MNILDQVEQIDHYRSFCLRNPLNAAAREGQHQEMDVSPQADQLIEEANTIDLCAGAHIVILHESADNGFPHTRPKNVICMPTVSLQGNISNTLRHEAIHLHQRNQPKLWDEVCKKEGWSPVFPKQISEKWRQRCRINPDTMMCPYWAWQEYQVPLPLFAREDRPRLNDAPIRWQDLRNGALQNDPPASFSSRYGKSPPQPEHPQELLAVEAADQKVQTQKELMEFLGSRQNGALSHEMGS